MSTKTHKFKSKSQPDDRKENKLDARKFQCKHCEKRFKYRWDFQRHTKTHTGEIPFQCNLCDRAFALKGNLNRHLIEFHFAKKPIKCDICKYKFKSKSAIRRHMKVHTDYKTFDCELCSKTFAQKGNLKRHLIEFHSALKPFKCDICQHNFKSKDAIRKHMNLHIEEKPFTCNLCDKAFALKDNFKRHKIQFHSQKSFKCDICKREFSKKSNLKRHITIHSSERTFFQCRKCYKTFTQKSNLIRHSVQCFASRSKSNSQLKHFLSPKEFETDNQLNLHQLHCRPIIAISSDSNDADAKPISSKIKALSKKKQLPNFKECAIVLQQYAGLDSAVRKGYRTFLIDDSQSRSQSSSSYSKVVEVDLS